MNTSILVETLLAALAAGTLLPVILCTTVRAETPTEPARGQLTFAAEDGRKTGAVLLWNFKAERWGMYEAILTFSAEKTTTAQLFLEDKQVEAELTAGEQQHLSLGKIYMAKQGDQEVKVITAANIDSLTLKPASEGEDIKQAENGSIALLAKDALTHSVKMRYEPKPKKNCLGFWLDQNDWAEWTFEVSQPGRFELVVTQGCGGGNEGSDVAVEINGQTFTFVVENTGGFQNWRERSLGELTIKEAGTMSLAIKPINKKHKALMDIHRIDLRKK